MKKLNVLIVLLSLAMAVSCGDDKKKKGDSVAFYDLTQNPYQAVQPSVVNGLFDPYTGVLEVGGQSYQPNQVYGIGGTQQMPMQQMPMQQFPNQQYGQQGMPTQQAGMTFLNAAYQQIRMAMQNMQSPTLRPAYQANGVIKFNVRVTYYTARYPGMPSIIPVLTAPVVAF